MELKELYKELEEEIRETNKVLFLGNEALLKALYIAGRSREEGRNLKTKAVVPPDSDIKNEEDAMERAQEKFVKDGIPNTYYRIGNIEMEDEKYPLIIDFRGNQFENLEGTVERLEEKGKILMKLPERYIYPIETTSKGFLRKKKKLKSTKKAIEDLNFEVETYKLLKSNEILVKAKEKNFKKPYLQIDFPDLSKLGEKIAKETLPHARYAMRRSNFCVKSDDENYLYVFEEVENQNKKPLKFQFEFLTGEASYEGSEEKRKSKRFKVRVLPNLNRFRKQLEEEDKLIIPKKRIKDYYS